MSKPRAMSLNAFPILADIFDFPGRIITGNALYKKYPAMAERLIQEEWLIPHDILSSAIIDGQRKAVTWRSDASAYQYFSPFLGWTTVPLSQLTRYTVNVTQCFHWILGLFEISPVSRAEMLVNDSLCYLGMTCLNSRSVDIYVCSHLHNRNTLNAINDTLALKASQCPTLVVSCKEGITPLTLPSNMIEVSFQSLLKKGETLCRLDETVLTYVVNHHAPFTEYHHKKALSFSGDYRTVYWGNESFTVTRTQAAVVEALHEQGGKAHHDYLRAQANSNSKLHRIMSNKVQGEWVTHPLWDTLIVKADRGYYRFCDDADIEAQVNFFDRASDQ